MLQAIKKRGWVVLVAVAAGVAFAAVAQAAIPAANGTIRSCYKNNTGDLRVVDKLEDCKNNETGLKWNQDGVPGPAGPAGAPGADGAAGAPGTPGISGYEVVRPAFSETLPVNGLVTATALCPSGKNVLGGGYVVPSELDTAPMSRPNDDNNGWVVTFHSNGGSGSISIYAICAFVN